MPGSHLHLWNPNAPSWNPSLVSPGESRAQPWGRTTGLCSPLRRTRTLKQQTPHLWVPAVFTHLSIYKTQINSFLFFLMILQFKSIIDPMAVIRLLRPGTGTECWLPTPASVPSQLLVLQLQLQAGYVAAQVKTIFPRAKDEGEEKALLYRRIPINKHTRNEKNRKITILLFFFK